MRRISFLWAFCGLLCFSASGQSPPSDIYNRLQQITDHQVVADIYPSQKLIEAVNADLLVALQSGSLSLDTLKNMISVQELPELNVTLFSYQIPIKKGAYQHECIVKNEESFIVLQDISDEVPINETMIFRDGDWRGSYVYNAIPIEMEKDKVIMIFGYDANDDYQLIKTIDFIHILDDGTVQTGYPGLFHEDGPYYRRVFNYNAGSVIGVNYNEQLDKIIFDNLVPMEDELGRPGAVTDGSYHGYVLKDGKWTYVDKIYDHKYDEAPRPAAVLDKRNKKLGPRN